MVIPNYNEDLSLINIYSRYKILSIDPGSYNLGVALSEVVYTELSPTFTLLDAYTVKLDKIRYYQHLSPDNYENRKFRVLQLDDVLNSYVNEVSVIAIEAPFFYFKKPTAFAILLEVVNYIEYYALKNFKNIPVVKLEPRLVKRITNVKHHSRKDNVIIALKDIFLQQGYTSNIDIETLDEHSIDAVAVALAYYNKYELFLNDS